MPIIGRTYYSNKAGVDGGCDYFDLDGQLPDLEKVNPISRQAFGRSVSIFVPIDENSVVRIGPRAPAPSYISDAAAKTPASYHNPNAPLTGDAGMKDALSKGIIRKATDKDARAWVAVWLATHPEDPDFPTTFLRRKGAIAPLFTFMDVTYVINKPFRIPGGAGGMFVIANGVPLPDGDGSKSNYFYDMNSGSCSPQPDCFMFLGDSNAVNQ